MIYGILYVILTATALLLVDESISSLPIYLTLFASTTAAIIYFHLVNLGRIKLMYRRCWRHKLLWLLTSIFITVVWVGTFYGTMFAGIFGFLYVFFLILGISGFITKQITEKKISWERVVSVIGLFLLLLLYLWLRIEDLLNYHMFIKGVCWSAVAGIAGSAYYHSSFWFAKKTQLTSSQILAVRFYGIIICCIFLMPLHTLHYLTATNLMLILGISVFNLILPIYFGQLAVLKLGPENSAIISSTCPIAAYFVQGIALHIWPTHLLLISSACSFFLAFPYIFKRLREAIKN